MAKENISKMKRQPNLRENIFANDNLDKGVIYKIYKELTWLYYSCLLYTSDAADDPRVV